MYIITIGFEMGSDIMCNLVIDRDGTTCENRYVIAIYNFIFKFSVGPLFAMVSLTIKLTKA